MFFFLSAIQFISGDFYGNAPKHHRNSTNLHHKWDTKVHEGVGSTLFLRVEEEEALIWLLCQILPYFSKNGPQESFSNHRVSSSTTTITHHNHRPCCSPARGWCNLARASSASRSARARAISGWRACAWGACPSSGGAWKSTRRAGWCAARSCSCRRRAPWCPCRRL